jgi:NitT/TauT family transport system permease protein
VARTSIGSGVMHSKVSNYRTDNIVRKLFAAALSPRVASVSILIGGFILLEILVRAGIVPVGIVARPSDAFTDLFTLLRTADFLGALEITASVTLIALALEVVVAVPFGYFLFRHRDFGIAYTGWLAALFAAPIFLLYPLFLVVIGRNAVTLIVMGFLPGVIPLVLQVQEGFLAVSPTLINVGRSFDVSEHKIFWKIMVPAAAPSIFTGFRLALMYTMINIIAIEYLVDIGGLGRVVADRYFHFDIAGTYSAIFAVTAISVFFNWLIGQGERFVRSR